MVWYFVIRIWYLFRIRILGFRILTCFHQLNVREATNVSSKHFLESHSLFILVGALLVPLFSFAQAPKFYLYVSLIDSGSRVSIPYTLHFGVHPGSTKCDDNPNLPATIILTGFTTRWFEAESSTVIEQDGPPGSPA